MRIFSLSFLFLFFSCSHAVHLVHLSDHNLKKSAKSGKMISVETEQVVVMGFMFDTNYVNQAHEQMIAKCPKGTIKNIMTRSSTSHAFFHWKNKIYMEGRCF
jgi:hypothetical protein